jgi:hypothetical protein
MRSQLPIVTILTSAVGLGVYIPALLLNYQFRKRGLNSEVLVLETFYSSISKHKFKKHQRAYHDNFALALMAHKMTRGVEENLETGSIDRLLQRWRDEERFKFVVWSGFWMPIIEVYRSEVASRKVDLHLCRIDAEISASFKNWPRREEDREIWLWNWEQRKLLYEIAVSDRLPIPYRERAKRLVIHGGGWGLGTYRSKIREIEQQGILLDIVAHDLVEISHKKPGNRYFMVDPEWEPWHKTDSDQHEFPPFAEIADFGRSEFKNREDYHELYDVISRSKAIVSKPGGGTLIDSLASATPIILLEPRGYAEEKNAAIWEYLGYGISYQKWQEREYRFEVLEQLHQNLLSRPKTTINYSHAYVEEAIQDLRIA